MIKKILTYYAKRLDEYLSRLHHQPEGLATVGLIGSAGEECPNKVVISLVNLEKETSGDMTYMQRSGNGFVGKGAPLMMNMHVMLAAVYDGKRYVESLSVLSETLAFIRSMPKFQVDGHAYTMDATMKLSGTAKQDVSLEGLNVNVQAKMGATVKGNATAELSASGQTTVKGAMVMIN